MCSEMNPNLHLYALTKLDAETQTAIHGASSSLPAEDSQLNPGRAHSDMSE